MTIHWIFLIGYAVSGIALSASLLLRVQSTLKRVLNQGTKNHWGAFLRFTSLAFLCFLIVVSKAQNVYWGLGVFLISGILTLIVLIFAQRLL